MLLDFYQTQSNYPDFTKKNDGTMEIPTAWIGHYSQLSFGATLQPGGVEITVWLDENGDVPLKAYCTSPDGLMDTIAMFDICLGLIKDKNTMLEKGIKPEKFSIALGHMMMLMETGEKQCIPLLNHSDQTIQQKFKKAHSIYSRAKYAIDALLKASTSNAIRCAVIPQDNMVLIH